MMTLIRTFQVRLTEYQAQVAPGSSIYIPAVALTPTTEEGTSISPLLDAGSSGGLSVVSCTGVGCGVLTSGSVILEPGIL